MRDEKLDVLVDQTLSLALIQSGRDPFAFNEETTSELNSLFYEIFFKENDFILQFHEKFIFEKKIAIYECSSFEKAGLIRNFFDLKKIELMQNQNELLQREGRLLSLSLNWRGLSLYDKVIAKIRFERIFKDLKNNHQVLDFDYNQELGLILIDFFEEKLAEDWWSAFSKLKEWSMENKTHELFFSELTEIFSFCRHVDMNLMRKKMEEN